MVLKMSRTKDVGGNFSAFTSPRCSSSISFVLMTHQARASASELGNGARQDRDARCDEAMNSPSCISMAFRRCLELEGMLLLLLPTNDTRSALGKWHTVRGVVPLLANLLEVAAFMNDDDAAFHSGQVCLRTFVN
jgi:hypothetical protein